MDIADLAQKRHAKKEERIENFRSPDPIGVLHIEVLSARQLPAADIGFTGHSSSDPYVVVKVGNSTWQTVKRHSSLQPVWGQAHAMDFQVFHMEQHVFVDVYDSDMLSFDDELGYVCTSLGRRPRITDVIPEIGSEPQEQEWDLHNGGKLKMRCYFRAVNESVDTFIEPQFLRCNECQEPLQKSADFKACSLCGTGPSTPSKLLRCSSSCFPAKANERFACPECQFRCCNQCWQQRRPACAMLRVCLREGLVPAEDVAAGVYLAVTVQGETQWSANAVRPSYEDMVAQSEAQRWIKNLCEKFDKASVAKCLEITPEQAAFFWVKGWVGINLLCFVYGSRGYSFSAPFASNSAIGVNILGTKKGVSWLFSKL